MGSIENSSKNSGHRLQGLQYVRAIAILFVVITHASAVLALPEYFNKSLFSGIFAKGAVGVDIFFVVSGFIISYVTLDTGTLYPKIGLWQYVLKRFARIVPFLWVAVIAYALVRFIGTGQFEWIPYLNSLFLFPIGEVRPNVVWSLRHEMLFYIIFAFSFLIGKPKPYILLLWCLSPIGVWLIGGVGTEFDIVNELCKFLFNKANLEFGSGVLLGVIYLHYKETRHNLYLKPWAGFLLALASILTFYVRDDFAFPIIMISSTIVVAIGVLIQSYNGIIATVWRIIGDASYSIYLTHNLVFLIGSEVWVKLIGRVGIELAIPLLSVLAIISGTAIHFIIEKPLVRGFVKLSMNVRVSTKRSNHAA